jgi:hypothetical protein
MISKPELMECCDIGNENVNPNSRAPAAACVENSELSLDTKSVSFLAIKSYSSCTSPSEYCIELYKQFKQIVFSASKFKLKFDGAIGKQIIATNYI